MVKIPQNVIAKQFVEFRQNIEIANFDDSYVMYVSSEEIKDRVYWTSDMLTISELNHLMRKVLESFDDLSINSIESNKKCLDFLQNKMYEDNYISEY